MIWLSGYWVTPPKGHWVKCLGNGFNKKKLFLFKDCLIMGTFKSEAI